MAIVGHCLSAPVYSEVKVGDHKFEITRALTDPNVLLIPGLRKESGFVYYCDVFFFKASFPQFIDL